MDYNEYLKAELDTFIEENFWGIDAGKYINGVSISTNTTRYPRDKNPFIEIRSTLLIPEKYYQKFREKIRRHQGVRAYVAYLLLKYKIHIANGMIPSYQNHTTKYQEKNQNLIKVAFRPNLDDWAELKLYRVSFGLSISAFLVYLLIADFVDFAEKVSYYLGAVGIPQSPHLDLWAKVYLSRKNSRYTTIFQYRRSQYG
ncbi:MAG: DUF1564 family protein [Leptospiraceae bacterium]|nr:DUF1564 family protein [Leptospiraceae bacterium]MBK8397080.1 DUF1564 family protein [Leptospiraceae bacterium]